MGFLSKYGVFMLILEISFIAKSTGLTNVEVLFDSENEEFTDFNSMERYQRIKRQSTTDISVDVYENSTGVLFSVDPGQPTGSSYRCEISNVTPVNIFHINNDGNVSLDSQSTLDFDDGPRQYRMSINVLQSSRVLKRFVVNITILDVNDKTPLFTNYPTPFYATVRKNDSIGSVVYRLTATDQDASPNSLRYYIDGQSDAFSINSSTGEIKSKRLFNRQDDVDGLVIILPVYASDTSADVVQRVNTTVFIQLGYMAPQFYVRSYMAQIPENNEINSRYDSMDTSDDIKVPVAAVNFQSDIGGTTIFSVYSANEIISNDFAINNGSVVALRTFNHAEQDEYKQTIRAQDSKTGLSNDAELTVYIMKGYKPMFALPVYTNTVKEDVGINDTILKVKASEGNSSVLFNYSLSVEDHFWVDSENGTGVIKVKKALDYESTGPSHSYSFNITVTNYDGTLTNTTALVVIYVLNVNDETPVFIHDAVSTIPDNIGTNRTVMNVIAVDKDGDTISYKFLVTQPDVTSTVQDIFAINPSTGRITLRPGAYIRPDTDKYVLTVVAEDNGDCCVPDPSQQPHIEQQNVTINIVDQKNFKPQFDDCSSYYDASLLEQQEFGTPVLKVSATDINRGENGMMKYSITSYIGGTKNDYFTIDPVTGQVSSGNFIFDREKIGNDPVKVTVKAEDNGQPPLSDECTFVVKIVDINDNSPEFLPQLANNFEYTGYVMNNASIGDVVINVRAHDADFGENAKITYTLENDTLNLFSIDAHSGVITVNGSLSSVSSSVEVTVVATDNGTEPKNNSIPVTINVVNEIDKIPPQWNENNPDWLINDNLREDDSIKQFNFPSNISNVLLINPYGAAVQLEENVRVFRNSDTRYTLVATNNFQSSKITQTLQLRLFNDTKIGNNGRNLRDNYPEITLNDTNNEAPYFLNIISPTTGMIELSVTENQTAGQVVGSLLAYDADTTPPFNVVKYRIVNSDGQFQINNLTGKLTTSKVFDREENPDATYTIQVVAYDGDVSSKPTVDGPNQVVTGVSIKVEDINDNPPYFTLSRYSFDVLESAPIFTVIGGITAQDNDAPQTSKYTKYSLEGSTLFSANESTGDIIVAGVLTGQANKIFELTFMADDGIYSTPVGVAITVLKSYNNRPTFNGNYDIKDIVGNRNYSDSETVFQIQADDPDCTGLCRLVYTILANDAEVNRIFHIDRYSGNVTLNDILQIGRGYMFSVMVVDQMPTRSVSTPERAYTTVSVQPANCNRHQLANQIGQCECRPYCDDSPCKNDATCVLNCTDPSSNGFMCVCPTGYTGVFCEAMISGPSTLPLQPSPKDNTWLIIVLICVAVVIIVIILVIGFLYMRRRKAPEDSKFVYDNEDYDIREDVMDYDEEGAGEDDHAGYDISIISKPADGTHPDKSEMRIARESVHPVQSTPIGGNHMSSFIHDRLHDADDDPNAPPYDTLREYDFEGGGSSAGSLSSINTESSDGSQDYQYLYDWGPKLAKLADMYNQYEDSD